jgi:hypothetical protein
MMLLEVHNFKIKENNRIKVVSQQGLSTNACTLVKNFLPAS